MRQSYDTAEFDEAVTISNLQRGAEIGVKPSYLTDAQWRNLINSGYRVGSGVASVEARQFPKGYRIATDEIGSSYTFMVSGPFGPVMAMYLRNTSDGIYGIYMEDPDHPVTIGSSEFGPLRRLEFDTPTDSSGRLTQIPLTVVPLSEAVEHGILFIEIE